MSVPLGQSQLPCLSDLFLADLREQDSFLLLITIWSHEIEDSLLGPTFFKCLAEPIAYPQQEPQTEFVPSHPQSYNFIIEVREFLKQLLLFNLIELRCTATSNHSLGLIFEPVKHINCILSTLINKVLVVRPCQAPPTLLNEGHSIHEIIINLVFVNIRAVSICHTQKVWCGAETLFSHLGKN